MKNIIITIFVIAVLVSLGYIYKSTFSNTNTPVSTTASSGAVTTTENGGTTTKNPSTSTAQLPADTTKTVIGTSISKNSITAYHFGTGTDELLFIGGIHGGYEWNTVLVAYQLMDYLKANPNVLPKNLKVTVIPVLNPDGLKKVVGTVDRFTVANVSTQESVVVSGRFNARNVDLNRNFDCSWKQSGVWQTKPVSGGVKVFSEPESVAIKNYVEKNAPVGVVIWYSAGDGVYSSSCDTGISKETEKLTALYATESGYNAHKSFDSYETSGDMANWLAKIDIPAISVLLTNHTDTEWSKNQKGVDALLRYYTK
jgi:hypothetical protein